MYSRGILQISVTAAVKETLHDARQKAGVALNEDSDVEQLILDQSEAAVSHIDCLSVLSESSCHILINPTFTFFIDELLCAFVRF